MSLVIEDGTGLSTATSYVTVTEARAYALARGVTLSADDSVVETLLIKAMDYLEAQRDRYQGYKNTEAQALQWPRYGVYVDGYDVSTNEIPKLLKSAQCQAAIEIHNGIDVLPSGTGNGIKSEKVDVISVEYSTYSTAASPRMRKVDALLRPLFNYVGSITARRVL